MFNPSKCEYIIIGGKRKDVDLDIFLYGHKKINRVDSVKIIGLIIKNQKTNPLGKM